MWRKGEALWHRTLAIAAVLVSADAAAQPAEQFFARKTVTITIGYTAGGSYDLYGRMVARHLGKHIPGQPTLIAQNMPGAGSLKAANYLYEVAPKDGTALGVVVESAALEQALANPAVQYDAAKFTYVGRVATSNNIFMQWHTAKVSASARCATLSRRWSRTRNSSPTCSALTWSSARCRARRWKRSWSARSMSRPRCAIAPSSRSGDRWLTQSAPAR